MDSDDDKEAQSRIVDGEETQEETQEATQTQTNKLVDDIFGGR
jgi:hypothetical protein